MQDQASQISLPLIIDADDVRALIGDRMGRDAVEALIMAHAAFPPPLTHSGIGRGSKRLYSRDAVLQALPTVIEALASDPEARAKARAQRDAQMRQKYLGDLADKLVKP